jgi:hypothetical protein
MNKKNLIPSLDEMDNIYKTALSNKTIDKMVSLENTTNAYNIPAPKWIQKSEPKVSVTNSSFSSLPQPTPPPIQVTYLPLSELSPPTTISTPSIQITTSSISTLPQPTLPPIQVTYLPLSELSPPTTKSTPSIQITTSSISTLPRPQPTPPPPSPQTPIKLPLRLFRRKSLPIKPKLPLFYYFFTLSVIFTLAYVSITQRQLTNDYQFRTSTKTSKYQNCSNSINIENLNNNFTNSTDRKNLNSSCNEVIKYLNNNLNLLTNKAIVNKINFEFIIFMYLFYLI